MTEEIRIGNAEQPWGFKYKLGWALMGPTSQAQTNQVNVNLLQSTIPNIEEITLKEQVNRFFLDDGLGVVTNTKKAMSVQDTKAKKMMEESTAIVDGHYEIGMLWNNDPHLPNNRDVAFRRLGYLRTRLEKDKELHKKYQAKIEEYVEKGYASKLQPAEMRRVSDRIWYLPHHPVFHPAKPGKVRIVFDAASRFKGTSLNDKLLHGPNLSNKIIEVLLRFRKEEIAIAADIQEMFQQVKVPPRDRDCLRFLWSPHDLDDWPEEYRMNVHIFGAKDSPSVANYALKRTAKDNSYAFSQEAVHAVEKDFYVDDLLKSLPNEEEAMRIANEVKELLKRGGFRLTKWASSSKRVLASIPESERAHPTLNLDLDDLPMQRALGLWWNVKEDAFEFKVDDLDKPETKSGILSVIASLYDPLGFAAPVALSAKSLLQRLWRKKADWDAKLAEAELKEWQQWKRVLPDLSRVKISHCYKTSGPAKEVKTGAVKYVEVVQLHNFSDASEIGYGTVSYIRTKFTNGTVLCSLAFGKSRSAPLRRISTPRLELQAAVLSIRISEIIQREIERTFSKVCYWTDSEVVLKYIQNEDKRFTVYVGNRVAEIREKSEVQQWRYCPSKDNPADDASRGLRPSELTPTCRWLNGPSFLQKSEAYWPQTAPKRITENDPEILENIQTNVVVQEKETALYELLARYSTWNKLKSKIIWLTRFKSFLRRRLNVSRICQRGKPTVSELKMAESDIIRLVQQSLYSEEYNTLREKKQLRTSSNITKLNPFLGENSLIRVGSRLEYAPLIYDAKFPPILPKRHWISELLVTHVHRNNAHVGQEHTLSLLRERVWICNARSLVRRIISKCFECSRGHAPQLQQQMAPLLPCRVAAYEPPFTYVGIDMFGPILVKQGRSIPKMWGCIFMCMTTRAIHLEVAPSLETDDFINVLRQFVARRGTPKEIRSDCGTNFRGADRELREATEGWKSNDLEERLSRRGINWIFHPPSAPHFSGVWERLIKDVKRALKAILKNALVTEHVLRTVFAEVEAILNSRPLTRSSDDASDQLTVTPAHFLLQKRTEVHPIGRFDQKSVVGTKRWKQEQILSNHFWNRWIKEYLTTLHLRQKWIKPERNVRVGDLVLLHDKKIPRGLWPIAIITKVFPGKDGKVRTVEIKTKDSVMTRPIVRISLLEQCDN